MSFFSAADRPLREINKVGLSIKGRGLRNVEVLQNNTADRRQGDADVWRPGPRRRGLWKNCNGSTQRRPFRNIDSYPEMRYMKRSLGNPPKKETAVGSSRMLAGPSCYSRDTRLHTLRSAVAQVVNKSPVAPAFNVSLPYASAVAEL
ncbi:hypothetical protein TWF225_004880 [Orbilia oligospora]|uniref:Uncharacterized protein n=1 Tax=Orbilia oligospora TaxID=2813651 RepID=A0A8H2HRX1_ORBOL|nr:hypothetical protein TWF225_004880 [Orbilia oligospora]KAF3236694.1 hypothetical protein TWF217_002489 [Orbilia oligospora]KAF3263159.1 hypothetical protein TWF128_002109 [Orbilia oligospora]TGJ69033.1 hypothetical protein EYR41_005102 [Orbilia oligospora]